jgi:hypothetical protein
MNHQRQPAIFVADSIGLDFLNTEATRLDKQVNWIDSDVALLTWMEQARLVPPDAIKALRAQAMPGEFDSVATQACRLREWFRAFVMARRSRKLGADDLCELEFLNRLLARDERFDQIVANPEGNVSVLDLRTMRRWRSPESLLEVLTKLERRARHMRDSEVKRPVIWSAVMAKPLLPEGKRKGGHKAKRGTYII